MASTKEFFDTHVMGEDTKPDWNEIMDKDTASVRSEPSSYVPPRPGNLVKWAWRNLDGELPFNVKKRIFESGVYFSSTPDLVNPYTGRKLGVKLTQRDNPYYLVVTNHGKDPAYFATTCPEEYVVIMEAYSPSFVEKTGDYKNWEMRVAAYNKKFPKNQF